MTTVGSSRQSCGGDALASPGGTYRKSLARGRPFSIGSTAGRRQVDGTGCSRLCRRTSTQSGRASTAQPTALISTPQGERGACCAGNRPVTRRSNDQGPSDSRCSRSPARLRDHRGQSPRHRFSPRDKELYKARSEVECTFNLLKQARRFATRYEKTLRNYAAVVAIGCALLWLRV